MKKFYRKPSIKVKGIETESPLATSPREGQISVGGNTGIGIGEGDPPTSGGSKGNYFSGSDDEPASSSNLWDK